MEIELYSKLNDPLQAIDRIGEMFAKSGMFGCEKVEQGKILALICMSERKSPVAISTNYDIVEGKLRKKALAALADFRTAGGKHRWLKSGDEATAKEGDRYAELELTDRDNIKITYRYSMADARAEGLIRDKSRWVKRPGNMLRARCISNGLGMLCPEIFAGEDEQEPQETVAQPLLKKEKENADAIDTTATVVTQASTIPTETKKPETEKAQALKPFSPADVRTAPDTGRLTVETMEALEAAIGEANMLPAITWLKNRKWIEDSLSELSVERARRLLSKPSEFIGTITKGAK